MPLTPEERQRIYEEEKARLEIQEQLRASANAPKREEPPEPPFRIRNILLIMAGLFVLWFFVAAFGPESLGLNSSQPPGIPHERDRAFIVSTDSYCAMTRGTYNFMMAALGNGDRQGLTALRRDLSVIEISGQTPVRIIAEDGVVREIRVQAGEHISRSCWIERSALR